MARNRGNYGPDSGRRREPPPFIGGMRSDGWGGNVEWRRFPGEEGWYGEGYEGMPGIGYDASYGAAGIDYPFGRRPPRDGRYDADYGPRGYPASRGSEFGPRDFGPSWEEPFAFRRRSAWDRFENSVDPDSIRALDIMTENPETVTPDSSLKEAARKMRELDVGILPVVNSQDGRRLLGVITDRDIAIRGIADGKDARTRVTECMSDDVRTVTANDSIREVMRVMREELVRRVPVVDREGRLVGIVAQADLAVEYGARDYERESEVAETIERISEPAQPRRRDDFVRVGVRDQTWGARVSSRAGGYRER